MFVRIIPKNCSALLTNGLSLVSLEYLDSFLQYPDCPSHATNHFSFQCAEMTKSPCDRCAAGSGIPNVQVCSQLLSFNFNLVLRVLLKKLNSSW